MPGHRTNKAWCLWFMVSGLLGSLGGSDVEHLKHASYEPPPVPAVPQPSMRLGFGV